MKLNPIFTLKTVSLITISALGTAYAHQKDPNHVWLDYSSFEYVLKTYVNEQGMVKYAELKGDREDLDQFLSDISGLSRVEYDTWPAKEKIAFWINAYNAQTLKAIVDHYPIEPSGFKSLLYPKNSIRQIPGLWNRLHFSVVQGSVTLSKIEHKILRKQFAEPKIHFALVCASMGCPSLRNEPYVAYRLEEQLNDQVSKLMDDPDKFRMNTDKKIIEISPIFEWFSEDFFVWSDQKRVSGYSKSEWAVYLFLEKYLPEDHIYFDSPEGYTIDFLDYDWSLNELVVSDLIEDKPSEY